MVHGQLKNRRVPLPSCAYNIIRTTHKPKHGACTGFDDIETDVDNTSYRYFYSVLYILNYSCNHAQFCTQGFFCHVCIIYGCFKEPTKIGQNNVCA